MRFKTLSKYFPSPEYLKPPHIGISFSNSNIKAISYDKFSPQSSLTSVIVPLEKGAIIEGKIVNMNEVIQKLSVVKESFDSQFVFFAVPDELTYIFSVSIPVSRGGNMTESIAFVLEENVPLSMADTIFDFMPVKITKSESGYNVFLVVAACVKKEIEKFIQAVSQGGLEPVGCVQESQAIANALIPKKSRGTFCVAHAREDRVGIYLVKDNIVHFATIRSVTEDDYKKQFLDEHDKFLEYASKYNAGKEEPIKTIFVCGEFEYAKKIVEAIMNSNSPIKNVKLSNVWANILKIEKDTPEISFEDSLNLASPIGAVLSDVT